MRTSEINAELGLPFGMGKVGGTWIPEDSEREAAWEMLVELCTRVSLVPIDETEGSLREALDSLRSLFPLVRDVLKRHGPGIAQASVQETTITFGFLSIALLNGGIRPYLSKWHTRLRQREESRPTGVNGLTWERDWEDGAEMRRDLVELQGSLRSYAQLLARACGGETILSAVGFRSS